VPADDLKFGDVIRFRFGGSNVTAMVVATSVDRFVETDEGTSMTPENVTQKVIVFGLANDGNPADYGSFHNVGETATFITEEGYEVLP